MSKSNIVTVAAIAVAAYFLFFRKDGKKNNTTENNTTTEVIEWPETPVTEPPVTEPPVTEPLIETTETKEPCPYCGTPNAIVKRIYRDERLIQQTVACGNKSCPGPAAKRPETKAQLTTNSNKLK